MAIQSTLLFLFLVWTGENKKNEMKRITLYLISILIPLLSFGQTFYKEIEGVVYRAQSIHSTNGLIANGIPDSEFTEVNVVDYITAYDVYEGTNDVRRIGGSYKFNGKSYYCNGFEDCSNLVTINLPNTIQYLNTSAFEDCSSLKNINLQDTKVGSISNYAFRRCSSLENLILPNTVTSIGSSAFSGCTSLKKLIIPSSVSSIEDAFSGVKNANLYLYNDHISSPTFMSYLDNSNIIFCSPAEYSYLLSQANTNNRDWGGSFYDINSEGNFPVIIDKYYSGISFKFQLQDDTSVSSVKWNNEELTPDNNGVYFIKNYTGRGDLTVQYSNGTDKYHYSLCTLIPKVSISSSRSSQTSLGFNINYSVDVETQPSSVGVVINGAQEYFANEQNFVEIRNLKPETTYNVTPFAIYNGVRFKGSESSYKTSGFNLTISVKSIGASYIIAEGGYKENGEQVTGYGFALEKNNTVVFDNGIQFKSYRLNPGTRYKIFFGIETSSNGRYWVEKEITTSEINWENIQSTAVSLTSARLKAQVNCDSLCSTGFEWRRIDSPDLIPSTKVSCPTINNSLQGVLNNLNPDVYYKFRPYYVVDESTTYYGEWVGLFTGDANVYFAPEVETYAPSVSSGTVTLSGFVLPGTDDVLSQGFEIRLLSNRSRGENEWQTYNAPGIFMQSSLELSNGNYEVRTFAQTKIDTTYGDIISFSVSDNAGINDVLSDNYSLFEITVNNRTISISSNRSENMIADISLYDISGNLIDFKHESIDNTKKLLFENLSPRLYFVVIKSKLQSVSKKILVM